MLSFLLTVYTIAGLALMAFIVVNIAFENKFTKFSNQMYEGFSNPYTCNLYCLCGILRSILLH